MTLEEKLAQKLKSSSLGELLDEDNLTEICEKAIRKAFLDGYFIEGQYRKEPVEAILVTVARDTFREIFNKQVQELCINIAKDPKFQQILMEAAIHCLPSAMGQYSNYMAIETMNNARSQSVEIATQLIRDKFNTI